jgi:hypothetical protein
VNGVAFVHEPLEHISTDKAGRAGEEDLHS